MYFTTVNTYNGRDQVTQIRQYQGSEGSGTYQDTTMIYDGYARLQTRHFPEQQIDPNNSSSTDHTTWEYNADDTVEKIIDARGASQTISYNARHLATGITFFAPAGITPTPNVSYGYDAAGNRTAMTDGLGSATYNYDQLSRLTSETRTINGVGTFPLTYAYNLGGLLTSVTDPFSANVGYQYDHVGRLNRVTGAGLGVAEYISQIDYRAWGGVKRIIYGNNLTTKLTYNNRLQAARYDGVQASNIKWGRNISITRTVGSYSHDLTDNRMDRSYVYDQAARISQAQSGAQG